MSRYTEAAREREVFRYRPSLLAESTIHVSPTSPDPSIVKPSSDSALIAFAQLGAFRLQATRAFISLFDQKYQYTVAEATCSSCLDSSQNDGDGDATPLWLSGTAIPRKHSLCGWMLDSGALLRQLEAGADRQPTAAQLPVDVVPDLPADPRLCNNPYVGPQNPEARFYAGVPIRSRRGIVIGVYYVLDARPRSGLDARSVAFLQDLSRAIMKHLETVAQANSHQRSIRMVRGLGSLVEGKGSMSRWWLDDSVASYSDARGAEGKLNIKQQNLQQIDEGRQLETAHFFPSQEASLALRPPAPGVSVVDTAYEEAGASPPPAVPGKLSGSSNTLGSGRTSGANTTFSAAAVGSGKGSVSTAGTTSGSVTQQQQDESILATLDLVSRAANIIRESIECEGVLFLDAAIGSFGGLVEEQGSDSLSSGDSPRESPASSSEDIQRRSSTDAQPDMMCKILGYSTSNNASIDGDLASPAHLSVPERFLKRLLRRYPEGFIFNFDESGVAQSGDSSEDDGTALFLGMDLAEERPGDAGPRRRRTRRIKPSETEVLTTTFVGARSIALIPLWDSHKERWFAGGFMWTRSPTRVFSHHGELSYSKAFGMVIMTEVARIDALRASKAKDDVLGSVSHELRSPLHGIILGTELLQDTKLDAFQKDALHTLETCGRTLVDTINHLLDYSKINRYVRMSRQRAGGRNRGIHQEGAAMIETGMTNLYSDISLDSLVEEVVESVYAGFSYQQQLGRLDRNTNLDMTELARANAMRRLGSIGPMDILSGQPLPSRTAATPVAVYLNIDPAAHWMFHAQPGALRRVVMNIFGNALKYTSHGFILISLTQDSGTEGKKSPRRMVTLSISDSGKGISAEYLQNQLYTPFSQEDSLATGVGLGLSLVKQITTTLGGRISVDSQAKLGTTVRISLPLRRSRLAALETATPAEADFKERIKQLKGLGVGIVGFDHTGPADYPFASVASQFNPRSAIERLCRQWLQMEVLPVSEDTTPAVYICTDETVEQIPARSSSSARPVPVIVICRDASVAHELAISSQSSTKHGIYEFISQPAGARKLARILQHSLKRWRETLVSQPETIDTVPLQAEQTLSLSTTVSSITPSPRVDSPSSTNIVATENSRVPDASQDPSSQTRSAFLIVDDNKINLKVLSTYMKKLGRDYGTAENGLEALDAYRQNPERYRCILMDISMPIMDGLESTRLIREFERQHELKPAFVVALTGLASASVQEEAFASGVNVFLTKPVPFAELGLMLESKGL